MMPIYGQIRQNRFKTFFLFFIFVLIFAGLGFIVGMFVESPVIGIISMLTVALILFLVSYYSGQNIIMSMAGAHPVKREEEPYLYHSIEAVAISAGIPTPRAYIIETEAPNAFAAGNKPDKAVVAVTRGLLNRLDRLELEGVIAHEIAHIRNLDVLTSTVAVVMAGTIIFVSHIMMRGTIFGGAGRRRSGGKGGGILIIFMIIIAILAPFFARLIKYAISREREYLADATAAELTGYPEGLANALVKISTGQVPEGPLDNKALHSLYIINPAVSVEAKGLSGRFLTTHPPIDARIKRLREM